MLDLATRKLLARGLSLLPFEVSDEQQTKIEDYLQLLNQWNAVHNLTAVREPKDQVTLHVLDCLSLLPFVPKQAKTLADVGSGAGLPALMIAIMRPQLSVFAIEAHNKKAAFMRHAALKLGLDNVLVIHERVESWQPEILMDVIVSRAMTSANELVAISKHLAHQNTRWHIMKGKESEEFVQAGFSAGVQTEVKVPLLDATRQILTITKLEETI